VETILVWFRQDLRLDDNPAWAKALASGKAVIPCYIHSPEDEGRWKAGGASRWWLFHALEDLQEQLRAVGSRLILRSGNAEEVLDRLFEGTGAGAVYWNRCYEPFRVHLDGRLKSRLKEAGVDVWSGNSALLREPWEVATGAGNPYKVYTPFSKACAKLPVPEPVRVNGKPVAPDCWPDQGDLDSLGLLPEVKWDSGFGDMWNPTRRGALDRLEKFLNKPVQTYGVDRDYPDIDGTSGLSAYLHWGQIGPREIAAAVGKRKSGDGLNTFYKEVVWREFAYHVLYHFPDTPVEPLQRKYGRFPWLSDKGLLKAWQTGQTGYPVVDAGMRQLWQTGWMHNRVRMIVASFLVKHLLHSWEDGAAWFWDTLVDADLASNTLGWQWAGGCGADAAPYFRIFNPITQSQKFDAEGNYIRRYVPELARVPGKYIHTPWELPVELQEHYDCRIGVDYPSPVIDHKEGRERALAALASIKGDPS
jgi:deoxyribodipyrimidine photo-lyase